VIEGGHSFSFRTFTGPNDKSQGVAFSPDGKLLAGGGYDSTVTIWNIDSGQVVRTLQESGRIEGVCFSCNGRFVGAGNREGMLRLWNADTGEEVLNMPRPAIVFSIRFSPDDHLLATTNGSQIDLWTVNWPSRRTNNNSSAFPKSWQ
jgi:WD40 repeat protein